MKRILCVLLILTMLVTSFAACNGGEGAETTQSAPIESLPVETTEPEELPDIPLTGDYGEYEFNILSTGNQVFNDFDFHEETSQPLDNAQYKRKVKVEEDFNIKINATVKKSHSIGNGSGFGYQAVNKQVHSGSCDYDLCIIAGYDVSVLAYTGWLYDMNSIPGINLTKSWWDANATESLSMHDVVFYTTGEITVSDNRAAYCILFNKGLLANYNLESPYDMVDEGTWTIENFGKLVRSVSEDLNQDGIFNQEDRFGLLVWDDSVLGMINAAGERCCTIVDDKITLTLYNENTLSAFEQYIDYAYDTQHAFHYQRVSENAGSTMWVADKALFWTKLVHELPELREMETDFGVLPYPKLTEEQSTYYTTISPFNSNFVCIPLVQDDAERTGVITEALAYYGKKVVTPALYDVTLIGQSTRDEESEPMLEIIFDNLIYDVGYYYQIGTYNERIMDRLRQRQTNFTSMYDTYKTAANAMLNLINTKYAKAVESWKTAPES